MKFRQKKQEVLEVREESQVQKYKLGAAGEKAVLERVVWSYSEAGCSIVLFKKTSADVRYWM